MQTCTTTSIAIAACWLLSFPVAQGSVVEQNPIAGRASVAVRSDVGWIGPGQLFNIIVAITPQSDWHVYWKNPGVSGAPTEIEVDAPTGFTVGRTIFPRPSIIPTDEGPTFGYNEQAAIFIPVTAPNVINGESVTFEITTSWLACKKVCVLGEAVTKITLATNPQTHGARHRDLSLVRWQKLLPKSISDLENGSCQIDGSVLNISGSTSERVVTFIGVERKGVRFKKAKSTPVEGESFSVQVPLVLDFSVVGGKSLEVEGLLLMGRNGGDPSYVVRIITNPKE